MWSQIKTFITNPVLISGLTSWFLAQFIKTIISLATGKINNVGALFESLCLKTGGLPSSHTALVVSVTTTIGFRSGINSDVFLLAFCFTMVTCRDAFGVRRANGLQAKKLNEIGVELKSKDLIDYEQVKEVNGHTPLEVVVGGILGLFVGIGFSVL